MCSRLQANNVFTVARRVVDGRELLYHSIKFTNGVVLLAELNLQPGSDQITVCYLFILSRIVSVVAEIA